MGTGRVTIPVIQNQPLSRRRALADFCAALLANVFPTPLRAGNGVVSPLVKPPSKPALNPVVVIDAGHGGKDPGAISVSEVLEKDLALTMARGLRGALAATDCYDIVLTRDSDVFVPLSDRVDIAREAKGNLFISLHADSIDRPVTRGASVYTLSDRASDGVAAALADRENQVDNIAGIDLGNYKPAVRGILLDLARRDTDHRSTTFAAQLLPRLKWRTQMLDLNHRSANFAVLRAPDVPSVLIELGFLSSRQDDRLLKRRSHRRHLVEAIVTAVDAFFADPESATS